MGVVDSIVRERAPSMAADVPVLLEDSLYDSLGDERVRSRLALGASVIALFLTIAGLYASMQYAVDARRGELAVRKAMGATGSKIGRMILANATRIVMLGLNLLSPFAWMATLGAIAVTSIGAALMPAIRAGHIDPAAALHYE